MVKGLRYGGTRPEVSVSENLRHRYDTIEELTCRCRTVLVQNSPAVVQSDTKRPVRPLFPLSKGINESPHLTLLLPLAMPNSFLFFDNTVTAVNMQNCRCNNVPCSRCECVLVSALLLVA